MNGLRPTRYFEATLTVLEVAADDGYTCHDFTEEEREQIRETLELVGELDESFVEKSNRNT